MISLKLTWVLVFELCLLTPLVHSQIPGCSVESIDLFHCLNQDNSSSIDKCCKSLNQAVQAGYNCLCSLFASKIPPLNSPFSLPLLNCFISLPPLSLCRVLAPMPVVLPPSSPTKEISLPPPLPPKDMLLPTLPQQTQTPLNSSTTDDNSTVAKRQPQLQPQMTGNIVPQLCVSKSGNKASSGKNVKEMLFPKTWLFFLLALQGCVYLAA